MTHYDLIVLGAGSGNTLVDEQFAHLRVAIVEGDRYGGTCLNRGCIPSKMYVVPADHAADAADGERWQLRTSYDGVDWPALRGRVFGRTDHASDQGRAYREGLPYVDAIAGTARFVGERTLRVAPTDGGDELEISADQVVVAVGSRPVMPDIPGLRDVDPHTSDTIMRMERLPRRLGVIGGGYVGCELAHVFASLGVEVVHVVRGHALLTSQDHDVARVFTALASQHWDVRLDTTVQRAERGTDGIDLHLESGGEAGDTVTVDEVLVAVGRQPNSDLLGLPGDAGIDTGIHVDDEGRVVVDEHQRTTAAGVWALGDISTRHPLKHVANHEARVVQHNLLQVIGGTDDLIAADHRFVPHAVFSSPQIGAVGLTEEQARAQGIDLAIGVRPYSDMAYGWALVADGTGWFAKVLADRATGLLVGAHVVGPQAASLVQPLITAMSFGLPARGLARGQYWIHPAPTEVVENALLALEKDLDRTSATRSR